MRRSDSTSEEIAATLGEVKSAAAKFCDEMSTSSEQRGTTPGNTGRGLPHITPDHEIFNRYFAEVTNVGRGSSKIVYRVVMKEPQDRKRGVTDAAGGLAKAMRGQRRLVGSRSLGLRAPLDLSDSDSDDGLGIFFVPAVRRSSSPSPKLLAGGFPVALSIFTDGSARMVRSELELTEKLNRLGLGPRLLYACTTANGSFIFTEYYNGNLKKYCSSVDAIFSSHLESASDTFQNIMSKMNQIALDIAGRLYDKFLMLAKLRLCADMKSDNIVVQTESLTSIVPTKVQFIDFGPDFCWPVTGADLMGTPKEDRDSTPVSLRSSTSTRYHFNSSIAAVQIMIFIANELALSAILPDELYAQAEGQLKYKILAILLDRVHEWRKTNRLGRSTMDNLIRDLGRDRRGPGINYNHYVRLGIQMRDGMSQDTRVSGELTAPFGNFTGAVTAMLGEAQAKDMLSGGMSSDHMRKSRRRHASHRRMPVRQTKTRAAQWKTDPGTGFGGATFKQPLEMIADEEE